MYIMSHNLNTVQNKKLFVFDQPIKEFFKLGDEKENIIMSCKNLELRHFYDNHQLELLYGLNPKELHGATIVDIVGKSSMSHAMRIQEEDTKILTNKTTLFFIRELELKNHRFIDEIGFRAMIRDSSNNIVGLFGMGIGQMLNSDQGLKMPFNPKDLKPFLLFPEAYSLFNYYPAFYTFLKAKITRREAEMLYFFIRYRSTKAIARMMGNISPRTIETHVNNCKEKLRVNTTIELIRLLWEANFALVTLEQMRKMVFIGDFHWK